MIHQRPVKGGRKQLSSCVLKEIRARVESISRHYGVSKSFVIATALAEAFNIKTQEDYHETDRKARNFSYGTREHRAVN